MATPRGKDKRTPMNGDIKICRCSRDEGILMRMMRCKEGLCVVKTRELAG
jgi:hypothetical protein